VCSTRVVVGGGLSWEVERLIFSHIMGPAVLAGLGRPGNELFNCKGVCTVDSSKFKLEHPIANIFLNAKQKSLKSLNKLFRIFF